MKKFSIIGLFLMLTFINSTLLAWDHPETVRLGGNIIGPGTSKMELLNSAGPPIMKEDSGINPRTGNIKEIWYYKYYNKNVAINISNGMVKQVIFTD